MADLRHFIIFLRSERHCLSWLVRAASVREAVIRYAVDYGAVAHPDGTIRVPDGHSGETVYASPLAFIEATEKAWHGGGYNGWEIRELSPEHFQITFAPVFCSEDPVDVELRLDRCRPLLRQKHPRIRARGFVWYLRSGVMVTFYRWPRQYHTDGSLNILARYFAPWEHCDQVSEWTGTDEGILEELGLPQPLQAT